MGLAPISAKSIQLLCLMAISISCTSIYMQLTLFEGCGLADQQDSWRGLRMLPREKEQAEAALSDKERMYSQDPGSLPLSWGSGNAPLGFRKDEDIQLQAKLKDRKNEVSAESTLSRTSNTKYKLPKTLLGIFTADFPEQRRYRKKIRNVFRLHPRVCSLGYFQHLSNRDDCDIIYTFVLGANPVGPTALVDDQFPILANPPVAAECSDTNVFPDMTLLNIKENMNEGKSQTWLKYASDIMKTYSIDYVAKADTDTVVYIDKFLEFVGENLPPAPWSKNILAGLVADKWWWSKDLETLEDTLVSEKEAFFREKYGKALHLYVEGQFYLMSQDLAARVVLEAQKEKELQYLEGHEDHDISAMAFHSSKPIKLIIIALDERFWQHKVKMKLGRMWHSIWEKEATRLEKSIADVYSRDEIEKQYDAKNDFLLSRHGIKEYLQSQHGISMEDALK